MKHRQKQVCNCENAIIHLQADAVLVDSSGKQHMVHSFLLVMKFPIFRGLPDQKIRSVTLAEASSEVVELLVEMAYGLDRCNIMLDHQVLQYFPSGLIIVKISAESGRILNKNTGETNICEPNIFSTNGSLDYFHRSSSNEMRAYKIEQE